MRQGEQAVWHASRNLRQCFQRIGGIVAAEEPLEQLSLLTVCLNELLVLALRTFRQGDVRPDEALGSRLKSVELFWEELRDHRSLLAGEWTVGKMARRCKLGVTRFTQFSRLMNNMTPMQYLRRCRIEAACRLMREQPARTITAIAMDCGFSSSQRFATVFRGMMGCTPRIYRARP